MNRRGNRLVLLDSEYRLQIRQQLYELLRSVALQHGVDNTDHRK